LNVEANFIQNVSKEHFCLKRLELLKFLVWSGKIIRKT